MRGRTSKPIPDERLRRLSSAPLLSLCGLWTWPLTAMLLDYQAMSISTRSLRICSRSLRDSVRSVDVGCTCPSEASHICVLQFSPVAVTGHQEREAVVSAESEIRSNLEKSQLELSRIDADLERQNIELRGRCATAS